MNRIPLEGRRFGRLMVTMRVANIGLHTAYCCQCDCGATANVRGHSLRRGETNSCGCLRRDVMAKKQTRHSMYGTPTYRSWRAMLARCKDSKHRQFKDYGGRGISIAKSWHKFEGFFADMGERPDGRTLDRYPDNNGNYEPGNCRWATAIQQRQNRRDSRHGGLQ